MKSYPKSSDATTGNPTTESSPTTDSTSSGSIQDYYRYRYEPVESQYGQNQDSRAEKIATPSTSDSSNTQNSHDNIPTNDDGAADETTTNVDNGEGSPLASAMVAVLSQWAEDVSSNYGLNMSQVKDLLAQIK